MRQKQGFSLIEFSVSVSLFVILIATGLQMFFIQNRYLQKLEFHSKICQTLENQMQMLQYKILEKKDSLPIEQKIVFTQLSKAQMTIKAFPVEPFLWKASIIIAWGEKEKRTLSMLIYKDKENED